MRCDESRMVRILHLRRVHMSSWLLGCCRCVGPRWRTRESVMPWFEEEAEGKGAREGDPIELELGSVPVDT